MNLKFQNLNLMEEKLTSCPDETAGVFSGNGTDCGS